MLKRAFPFFKWVHELPEDRVKALIMERYPGSDYIIDDYRTDLIGFLSRCEKICNELLDEYNSDLTDRYFMQKLGEPPHILTVDVKRLLDFNDRTPIQLLYKINQESEFYFLRCLLSSEDFNDLGLCNLAYNMMIRIYENDDSSYHKKYFGDN